MFSYVCAWSYTSPLPSYYWPLLQKKNLLSCTKVYEMLLGSCKVPFLLLFINGVVLDQCIDLCNHQYPVQHTWQYRGIFNTVTGRRTTQTKSLSKPLLQHSAFHHITFNLNENDIDKMKNILTNFIATFTKFNLIFQCHCLKHHKSLPPLRSRRRGLATASKCFFPNYICSERLFTITSMVLFRYTVVLVFDKKKSQLFS